MALRNSWRSPANRGWSQEGPAGNITIPTGFPGERASTTSDGAFDSMRPAKKRVHEAHPSA
ncbi:MAG TPA: hypothetical protein DCY79_18665 [Planctomycetaceae bacterium]|nr:hypothetical protein [Blastopirellula sp.]HAY81832.1 hypothetical protein [Planctomycetaceae bacterium]